MLDRRALGRNIAELERPARGRSAAAAAREDAQVARDRPTQLEAGAIGISVATAWEALALARAGIDDLLVANEVWGIDR